MTELDELPYRSNESTQDGKKAAELKRVITKVTYTTGKFCSLLDYSKKVRRKQDSFNSYFISIVKEITYEACADSLFWL